MRASFLDAIKHLLPSGPAWNITNKTDLRRLFEAIAVLPEELRKEIENVYKELEVLAEQYGLNMDITR